MKRKPLISSKTTEWVLRALFFTVLAFTVYWSILLSLFAIMRFVANPEFESGVLILFVFVLPYLAVLNFRFYVDELKKDKLIKRWSKWFKNRHDEILFAIVFTMVLEVVILLVVRNDLVVSETFKPVLAVLAAPTLIGELLIGVVREGTDQYFPMLAFVNELGVLVGVSFQLIASYYLAKFLFWAPHVHHKKN